MRLVLYNTCIVSQLSQNKYRLRDSVRAWCALMSFLLVLLLHLKTLLGIGYCYYRRHSTKDTTNNCNCRVKEKCPVDNKCQTSSLIYQATVTRHDNNKDETYIGLTDNTFKTRYNGHTNSFRHSNYRNSTALSNYIWMLKDKKISYSLKWKIIDRGRAYKPSGKKL